MPIWTERELADMRASAIAMFDHRCRVMREPADDPEDEPTVLHADLPCHHEYGRTREETGAGGTRTVRTPQTVMLPYGTDIIEADFINRVVDQSGAERLSRAHGIAEIERHEDHIRVVLTGVR